MVGFTARSMPGTGEVNQSYQHPHLIKRWGLFYAYLSTHLIDEVSNLLEHIFVMADGELILDQDAENLRGMAFTLTGRAPEVEAFISGKEVIHREPFGGLLSVTIIRDHHGHELKQAETIGLEITPVSLQQLSIYLTTKSREQKGAMTK